MARTSIKLSEESNSFNSSTLKGANRILSLFTAVVIETLEYKVRFKIKIKYIIKIIKYI